MAETRTLPLLPLRGMVVFPYMMIHLDVARDRSMAAIEEAMVENREVMLTTQMDAEKEEFTPQDLYKVGTVAEVRQVIKLPGDLVRVLVEGKHRAFIHEYHEQEKFDVVDVEEFHDRIDTSLNMEALNRAVVHQFEEWVRMSKKIPPETLVS
ncbi:MAG: LON peptidase substrate-binding domain-containing protein, partial [Selenomonas sp.]|nr:LON peptidase substrate-binding domain-containing protein [Selenomonas sp.]